MDIATPGSTFDTARTVTGWLSDGRSVTIARMLSGTGLAGRDSAPFAAWVEGDAATGSPLAAAARGRGAGLMEVVLSDPEAEGVGLACGGQALVLVQNATDIPDSIWAAVRSGDPVGLLDAVDGSRRTAGFTAAEIPSEYARFFGRAVSQVVPVAAAGGDAVLTSWWPVTRLLVVGGGPVADALTAQADLLGWTTSVIDDRDPSLEALAGLGRADAVVVLSHDREVDGPLLAAAISAPVGYVGAMGSRHTQTARAAWFVDHGVGGDVDRIHGPAGLDIGGFGPAEIALSIVAEIVAVRTGRSD